DAKDIKQITIYERWRIEEKKIKNEQIQILSKNAPQLLTFVKSLNKFQEGRRWSRGETIRLFDVKVFLDNDELIFFNITLKKEHPNIAFLSFKNKTKSYWNAESKALYFWLKQNGLLE
ncbi:MAG: hypothetical protein MI863_09005, partial [Desulfobacterales bacterium]|nr:hypothetical protein [Desulfobacterales bacterium]